MNLAQADFLIVKTYYHIGQETSCHFERGENERMLSETLIDGLKRYEIGSKIRTLRLGKKLGLVQLGEHTGLSAALLSKIERGNLFPTLPTLLRIAMVFGVGLDYFFVETDDNPIMQITRRNERVRLPNRPAETPSYFFESLNFDVRDRKVDIYFAEFLAGSEPSDPHEHAGAEFIYIAEGRLVVTIKNEPVVLGEGDTIHFDSGVPHSYRLEQQNLPGSAIVIVLPALG